MAKSLLAQVFAAGFAGDPTIAPGVVAPIGSLLPRLGTNQLYQKTGAGDTDWTAVSFSVGTTAAISWPVGVTWATVYAQIQAIGGPVVVLVEHDPLGFREMTDNGGTPTNLWNVEFCGLAHAGWSDAPIPREVDIRVASGFVLGIDPDSGYAALLSKNIAWQFETAGGAVVPLNTPVSVQLDGGNLHHNGGTYCFETDTFIAYLTNGARLIGTGGTALVRLTGNNSDVQVADRSQIGNASFDTTTGAKTITVRVDPTTDINGSAFDALITPTYVGSAVILISPNGTQFTGTVDDAGVLTFS